MNSVSERLDSTAVPFALSPEDQRHLAALAAKHRLVQDRIIAVIKGYATGLYLHGEGGLGKSFLVEEILRQQRIDYKPFNSRMSGRGLFDQLGLYPGAVHVLDDMETLFKDKGAQGVLRSALWAQRQPGKPGPLERPVTWTTFGQQLSFIFTGGIIVIANRPIDDVPELRAIKTRIACLHLEATVPEIRALMRQVAARGYDHGGLQLESAACLEVCEFVITQAAALRRSLDMRMLINALADRVQWEEADAACHWQDLVAASLRESPAALRKGEEFLTRAARKQWERQVIAEILAKTSDAQERRRLWAERTGKSPAAWYRRLAELGGEDSSPAEK